MNDLGLLRFGTTPQLSRNAMARGVGNRLRSLGAPGNRARLRDVSMAGTVMVGFVIGLAQALGRAEAGTDNILYWHDTGNGLAYPAQWMISSSWWVYPPPLGQSLEFIHPIGVPAYLVASSVLLFAALAYVARGWSLPLVGLGFLGIAFPSPPTLILAQPFGWALLGNVQLLMAAAIVAGMRWPAAWAVPLLTKIGPGVGLLWFAVRHEWRNLSIALAATLAISAASFLLSPSDWANWLRFVASNLNSPMDSKGRGDHRDSDGPDPVHRPSCDERRPCHLGSSHRSHLDCSRRRRLGNPGPLHVVIPADLAGRDRRASDPGSSLLQRGCGR